MKSKTTRYTLISAILVVGIALVIAGCKFYSPGSSSAPSVAQEPPGLPPDPGPAGKATLGGIITNPDGIRDDIYRYIVINHQDSEKVREALFQYARVIQNALLDAGDKQKSVIHGEEVSKASECLTYILGNDLAAARMSDSMKRDLRPIILNTDARNTAYLAYNKLLGGENFPGTPASEIASACTFDPSTLPN